MARLAYVIKFVADMDRGVAFYRDTMSLAVKMHTPFWSEFDTGETVLALHPASVANPAGPVSSASTSTICAPSMSGTKPLGATFTAPPAEQHGTLLARILDCDGAEISLSG